MKNYFYLLLLLLLICCSNKYSENKPIYFVFDPDFFKTSELNMDSFSVRSYSFDVPVYTTRYDSTKVVVSHRVYFLDHFLVNGQEKCPDAIFTKHKLFMDSILYFDSEWLKSEKNLQEFWGNKLYGLKPDTLEIYMIEPKGSDSLVIRRVHRGYHPNREG